MSYQLGLKALKRLILAQEPLAFHRAKLSNALFHGENEIAVFKYVAEHLKKYQALPQLETITAQFPDLKEVECPEPPKFYVDKLEERFIYQTINEANLTSQQLLKGEQSNAPEAISVLRGALNQIAEQQTRQRLLNFGKEAGLLVQQAYHDMASGVNDGAMFGWPSLDDAGGLPGGEVASIIGRPAQGKSFMILHGAQHGWAKRKRNTMMVSMEMDLLSQAQRGVAMYAKTNLTQLKKGAYSSHTWNKFKVGLDALYAEEANFFIMDGNLAACPEDIYALAAQLNIQDLWIDGGYLLRSLNPRLDRFQRVADNAEKIKRFTQELHMPTIVSWQFNREAAKKVTGGKGKGKQARVGLEDIGSSDVIGQISGIVLGLWQEDGVETISSRQIDIMKGRNGEVGQFSVNWDFGKMDFSEVKAPTPATELEYL